MALPKKFYPLGDLISLEEFKSLGFSSVKDAWGHTHAIIKKKGARAEKRMPIKGEWYLSGAIPTAYKATTDLPSEYIIVELVRTVSKMVTTIVYHNGETTHVDE